MTPFTRISPRFLSSPGRPAMGPWIAGLLLLAIYLPFHFPPSSQTAGTRCKSCGPFPVGSFATSSASPAAGSAPGPLQKLDPTFTPWPDAMYLDVLVPCLCAGMGVLLTLLFFRPRPALLFLIHGLILTIGGFVLAILLPGFSYLFLLPAAGVAPRLNSFTGSREGEPRCPSQSHLSLVAEHPRPSWRFHFSFASPSPLGSHFRRLPFPRSLRFSFFRSFPFSPRFVPPSFAELPSCLVFALSRSDLSRSRPRPSPPMPPNKSPSPTWNRKNAEEAQVSLSTWEGQVPDSLAEDLSKLEQPNPLYSVAGTPYQTEKSGLTAPEVELLNWNAEGTLHRAKLRFTSATPPSTDPGRYPPDPKLEDHLGPWQ